MIRLMDSKMFAVADTNNDGLVSRASFSKLVDTTASIPWLYGYAPMDTELYKTVEEKELARQKMFKSMDLKGTGVITADLAQLASLYASEWGLVIRAPGLLDKLPPLDRGDGAEPGQGDVPGCAVHELTHVHDGEVQGAQGG